MYCSSGRWSSARPRSPRSSRAGSASRFRSTSGPVIAKAGDLAAQLTNLEPRDVLFIDEIHRLNPAIEGILYPAMEDFQLDLIIGTGPAARSVKIDSPNSRSSARPPGRPAHDAVARPVRHSHAAQFLDGHGVGEHRRARRARDRPGARRGRGERDRPALARHAPDRRPAAAPGARLRGGRRRARGDRTLADEALRLLSRFIGLDPMDRRYLDSIALNFGGGPVGVETIAAALSEPRDAIEDIIEPYLIQLGFVQRTPRGVSSPPTLSDTWASPTPAAARGAGLFEDEWGRISSNNSALADRRISGVLRLLAFLVAPASYVLLCELATSLQEPRAITVETTRSPVSQPMTSSDMSAPSSASYRRSRRNVKRACTRSKL